MIPLPPIDPRVRLVAVAAIVLVTIMAGPEQTTLRWAMAAALLAMLAGSRIAPRHLIHRLSHLLPFILLAILPVLLRAIGVHSGAGSVPPGVLVARAAIGILGLFVLSVTSPFEDLIAGLRSFGVPMVILESASLFRRYLDILRDEARRMARARNARGWNGRWIGQATTIGHMAGFLFLRSHERSERLTWSMSARGYRPGLLLRNLGEPGIPDAFFTVAVAAWIIFWSQP